MNQRALVPWMLLLMILPGLVACQSNGGQLSEEPPLLIESVDARQLGYRIRWVSDIDVPDQNRLIHAVRLGDVIVTHEYPGNLFSGISTTDGKLLWRRQIADRLDRIFEPLRYGDQLIVNSQNRVYLLDIYSGDLKGIQNLDYVVTSAPAHIENYLIFGSVTGLAFAHDISIGYTRWRYQMAAEILTRPVTLANQYVFAADARGVYALLNARDGELIWKGRTFDRISTQPQVTRLGIVVPSEDFTLYMLDRTTGGDKWKFRTPAPLIEAPIVLENSIYLPKPGAEKGMYAIDALRGEKLWDVDEESMPVWQEDGVLMLKRARSLWLVEAQNGDVLNQAPTAPLRSVLAGEDESHIYLIGYDGRMVRLDKLK